MIYPIFRHPRGVIKLTATQAITTHLRTKSSKTHGLLFTTRPFLKTQRPMTSLSASFVILLSTSSKLGVWSPSNNSEKICVAQSTLYIVLRDTWSLS